MTHPFNFAKLLSGASELQEKLENAKKDLRKIQVTGSAGGDAVQVRANGERKIVSIEISDSAMDDKAMLQDLIAAATNDAMQKAEAAMKEKMEQSLMSELSDFM